MDGFTMKVVNAIESTKKIRAKTINMDLAPRLCFPFFLLVSLYFCGSFHLKFRVI